MTLDEAKLYQRVDQDADDQLIEQHIANAEQLSANILRAPLSDFVPAPETFRHAVLYGVAQTYEYRESLAALTLQDNVRCLIFTHRSKLCPYRLSKRYDRRRKRGARDRRGEKTKGRKRHIVVDVMGNLLALVVHAANQHDTKSGIEPAKLAVGRYPAIEKFCADAG